ncbi:glycosyltransferase [Methanobrevibacter filiformis]|uniref:CDP-glycerol:poly(Glycerophosphate) glycerophosphotransferase n=1 Tax=Methanobrevibacter filiformis TaxID=55758 RepID=A0A166F4K9_9EURY|nr:glycosyltransferase [Methanobrevibacter filiformis]KZX17305.1 CDP-glycerol:poly(glycerophosphate) glycerophosphotransferase [Methanobrevibacter filiformis]
MKKFYIKSKRLFKKLKRETHNVIKDSILIRYYNNLEIDEKLIVVESKNGKDIGGNIFYLLKELSDERFKDFKVVLPIRKNNLKNIDKFFLNHNISNIEFCEVGTLKYYKYLFSGKYLFNDSTFPSSFIKKDSQIYVNLWHGTPLKKLGRDVPRRAYALGNVQKNFIMADYLLYPSQYMEKHMIDAYMLRNLTNAKILNMGYPRNSIFLNDEARKSLKFKLGLENKEIIVYMPTYRGALTELKSQEFTEELKSYLSAIDSLLHNNQIFYVKLHPFVKYSINCEIYNHIKVFPEFYETYEFLNIADTLITDYSSIFFDFAVTRNKIILFPYDESKYSEEHGLYMDLEDLPFPKVYNPQDLINEINSEKNYNDDEFIEKFCSYEDIDSPKYLCDFIISNKKDDKVHIKEIKHNGKENVLFYSGNLAKNGITSSMFSLLENIDLDKRNYFLSFRMKKTRRYSLTVSELTREVDYIPINDKNNYNFLEALAYFTYYKLNKSNSAIVKQLDKSFKRNIKKHYYNTKFDMVVHFTGYEQAITSLLRRFDTKRVIYAHNDLVEELNTKKNQHFLTLKDAYNDYDKIAIVSEDLKEPTLKIKGNMDNVYVVENFISDESILEKSKLPIHFDEITKSNVELDELKDILNSNSHKFITIGRFSHEKGHLRLLKVFNEYYKRNKDVYLIIIGGYGRLYRKTLEYAESLECYSRVVIINYMSNPFPILKSCDLFILSSFYEGLGLVLLEADILGIKVFSTDIKGPKTFMEKYNGLLVENSENGICKGINDYFEGRISKLNIDYKEYNQNIHDQFEELFK